MEKSSIKSDNPIPEINEKKKLIIATESLLPRWDGIARVLSEIIPRLTAHYDITVIAPDFGAYEDPNITLVKIPLMKFFKVGDFRIPKSKPRLIASYVKQSDIVFTQTIGTIGTHAIRAAKKHKKPVAAFIHSVEWELVQKAMGTPLIKKYSQIFAKHHAKSLYNQCSMLIMPSQNVAELFVWNNIRTPHEIAHLGVDTVKFIPPTAESKKQIREQLGFTTQDVIIGYHGRISREKDLITLLRAFTRLQLLDIPAKLLIVGDGLSSIKNQLSSRKDVFLVGTKNNPIPYLQAMDIYVMPSLTETTCLSVLEAMSCGVAVISTEVGFIKSYIKNNYNGFFFEKQNPYHLTRQLQYLIANPQLRVLIGEHARTTIVDKFSWDKTAAEITRILEKLA